MNRIKKGDQVVVIAGKDKGKKGDVVRVEGDRVVVSNVNIIKRHTKPNPQAGVAGGVVEREASMHISNIALFNPATGKVLAKVAEGDKADIDMAVKAARAAFPAWAKLPPAAGQWDAGGVERGCGPLPG